MKVGDRKTSIVENPSLEATAIVVHRGVVWSKTVTDRDDADLHYNAVGRFHMYANQKRTDG